MTNTQDLLILDARAIDPSTNLDAPRDLLLREGRIAAIESPGALSSIKAETIDATGLVLSPGLIDIHVHLREPGQTWKETIATGTRAAAAGGFTTVVAMPNTVPVNDSVDSLNWMLDPARKPAIHLLAMPAATLGSLGQDLSHYEALAKAGAVGFTDDGKPILEDAMMRAALVAAARLCLPISQHAEDTRQSPSSGMNAGPLCFRLGLRGMTVEAESSIVERDIQLLRDIEKSDKLRPHLHVQHVSTARALEAIRSAKAEGLHVTCEAAPHHFALTEEAVIGGGPNYNACCQGIEASYNTNAKMNPPLRAESDRQAVLAALLDGTIDCIATDHAPHASHEKEVEFERAPNGITGLETALGLALRILHREQGLSISRVLQLMSTNPAQLIQLKDRGNLTVGSYADLILFHPTAEWTFQAAASLSKSKNTPFDQTPMLGQIKATLSEGRIVHRS
ncbi:dihydroorotase [Granulicella sp. dw_53]|uniref:dihydroorotase n=1 Tax=Granulicella sp. dw_53 TaxID=2719792 RepID=UPI001BD6D361|nr:dihydroorotase [Granulicella sp. dw_53]